MGSSSRAGSVVAHRAAGARFSCWAGLALAAALAVAPAATTRADTERLHVALGCSRTINRFQSFAADSAGLSLARAFAGELDLDFRVFDAPMAAGAQRPALHITVGGMSDERTLGPYLPGQTLVHMPVLTLRSGVYFLVPLELVRPNAGVAFRVGWAGAYVIGRTGGAEFLTVSKARFGFERTGGWFEGSRVEVGMGRDETFGRDAASGRWDVHVALEGRLLPAPARVRPAEAGKAAATADPGHPRIVWVFGDVDVDTDGGVGPDGIAMRFGISADVPGMLQGLFGPTAR
jgi:hypothetical protein